MSRIWISCLFAVSVAACTPEHMPIELRELTFSITPASATVTEGETVNMGATLIRRTPRLSEPPNDPISWASQNEAVAVVDPDGTVRGVSRGSSFIVAASGSYRDSAQVTVLGSPGAAAGRWRLGLDGELDYPNEPEGNELIAASRMDEPFPWGPDALAGGEGAWWQWPQDEPNTGILVGEGFPGAPHYNRTRYPVGLPPGNAPVNWGAWNPGSSQRGDEFERIYFSMHVRLVPGGRLGRWESQRVGTKLGFFGVGRCNGAHNEMYPILQGGLREMFTLRMGQQNIQAEMWGQNRHRVPMMRVGVWHHWEIEMVLNDPGRPNGALRWWVDGTLIMEHSTVVYRSTEDPCGFLAWKWNPTWGGTGGAPKAQEDYIDLSDVRISGRPLREGDFDP